MEKNKKTDKKRAEIFLSTPKPTSTSTVTKKKSPDLRLDSSFGIISINSDDLNFLPERSSYLKKDEKNVSKKLRHSLETGLPSKYLKPTTNSTTIGHNTSNIEKSGSTINESDLRFSKNSITQTSTPRCSNLATSTITTEDLVIEKPRSNLSEALDKLSTALLATTSNRLSLDQFAEQFQKTMSFDSSFKPSEEMLSQLQQDEYEWNNENSLPIYDRKTDFTTTDTLGNSKVSMGAFFYQKSDDLGNILAKSPIKQHKPVPLVDLTTTIKNNESWSVSKIQQILNETQTTPTKAVKILNKPKTCNCLKLAEKENIVCNNLNEMIENQKTVRIKSPINLEISPRSSSSLSQLPNGRLPIETTNKVLIWDCVKIGKDVSQQFSIRNKSNAKLRLQCSLSGPVFKIKETSDFEYRSIIRIVLHSYETRTISVRFSPMSIGACTDEINFQTIDLPHEQLHKQSVILYGYGGNGSVSIYNTFKDASGKLLLSLGAIDNRQQFQQNFLLKNLGNLATFALCNFQLKTMYKFANIDIKPKKLVLLPQQECVIEIIFKLTKSDLQYIKNCQQFVTELGVITLITGTEVNRGRIRRLCRKLLENKQNLDQLCQQLYEEFPNESIPNDLKSIKEPVIYLDKLLTNLNKQEITIILENDCDTTMVNDLNDHTITFHSLYGDIDDTLFVDNDRKLWKIEPNVIILTKQKISDIIVITSIGNKLINYEILSKFNEFDIEPKRGQIPPNKNQFVTIKLRKMLKQNQDFNVSIRIDNETFSIIIKVLL